VATTFFIDRNLGKKFARTLRDAGVSVELHDDHFDERTMDVVWIPAIAERGWVAVTKDDRIRYRPLEKELVLASRARLLLLTGKADLVVHAQNFIHSIASVERFINRSPPPWFAKLRRPSPRELARRLDAPGSVEKWMG
jgi:uncharacterized protein with PIN domain